MLFGILMWIIISLITPQTSPEFVVREIEACCHHRVTLTCGDDSPHDKQMRIVVVQARYVIDQEEKIAATAPSSQLIHPFADPPKHEKTIGDVGIASDNLHHLNSKAISLWDLDIKFVHDLINDNLPDPVHVNAPSWHPSHISTYQGRQPFLFNRNRQVTTPPLFPQDGLNFTDSRVIEMPPYHTDFLDKDTIWREPLFQTGHTESTIRESVQFILDDRKTSNKRNKLKGRYDMNGEVFPTSSSRESRSKSNTYLINDSGGAECWSYQALSSTSSTFTTDPNRIKPPWHFKDLRAYFNQRCSGRNNCTVELFRGKQPDPDVTRLCHLLPEGKITVKYLCYNASSEYVHSRCNVDVMPAEEGFLHNPGYPDLYPGDQPCQWRLHFPQQKLLLVFFDISLRGQEKSKCRDQLVTSEENSKLFSTCGDHSSAVAVLSEGHELNVTLLPESRLAFPKRGFLIYYRVLGCRDPTRPSNSYMVFRNATHAYLLCDLGHLYPDTLTRDRWILCNPLKHTWTGTISHCQDIRSYSSRNGNLSIASVLRNDPSLWPVRVWHKQNDILIDYILPICVMIALFSFNGIVLFFIWRQRQRLEEMENERNQEMEEICCAVVDDSNSPVDESTFSFPSSAVEDLWHDDHFDDDETDQDRTLTTLTLHTTSSPPDSAAAMKHYYDSLQRHNGGGVGNGYSYYRMSQDGSSSGIFSNTGLTSTTTMYTALHQQPTSHRHGNGTGPSSTNGTLYTTSGNSSGGIYYNQHGGGLANGSGNQMNIMANGNGSFPGTHQYVTGYSRSTAV